MAWTTPRTYVTAEIITASILNLHVRDNLNALDARRANGSYTGDSSVNKAIAHGLGIIPKLVLLVLSSGSSGKFFMVQSGWMSGEVAGVEYGTTVTAWNATNFYVGNVSSYAGSANLSGTTYYWAAL